MLFRLIAHCVDEFDGDLIVRKVKIRPSHGVYRIRSEVEVPFGHHLTGNLHELRDYVVDRIEKFTGIMIAEFDLVIAGVAKRDRRWVSEDHETPEVDGPKDPTQA